MWIKSDREVKNLEAGIYKEVVSVVDDDKENTLIDFEKLKNINNDVIAWIKIEDTYINYPILQGPTDEYYLKKDIYKRYNYSGSIFVYSNINKQFLDENTVIYGHNMKNGRMFANLNNIYNKSLGTDINIDIYTENEHNVYKVFSCYIDKPNKDIITNNFTNNEKKSYIDLAIKKSKIDFNYEINYESNIITLITCGKTDEERIIVHAIKTN